ncbi:alcohol dehydrogenase [Candidatus Heimdallarchaeota archaeon B3_Heim]|nr:MAG: alcohol dehydrogenase [Candidatus Heimdallarchaeota archaeon B3_Heim]
MLNNVALFTEPKSINLQTIDIPKIKESEILVKTAYCGLCGTDIHLYDGKVPFANYPLVPGHEFSGEIIKVGSKVKNDLKIGDRVAINPNLSCYDLQKKLCYYCEKNRKHFCVAWEAIGVTLNGAFAEYVICPSTVAYKIPDNVSLKAAAFMEPLACCLHGLNNMTIMDSDVVFIIGCGPIGLLMLSVIKATTSCKVIVSEPVNSRRNLARKIGADVILNPLSDEIVPIINSETCDKGVDVAIECVGLSNTAKQAIGSLNKGGKALIFGVADPLSTIDLDIHRLYSNEISIFGSFTNPNTNMRALDLLSKDILTPIPIISHEFPIKRIEEAISLIKSHVDNVNKILINP